MKISTVLRTMALAAIAAVGNIAWADDAPKPDQPEKKKNEVKVEVKDDGNLGLPGDLKIKFIPSTQPAEEAVKLDIAPDARKLLDQVSEAYSKLKSVRLAGSFTGDLDAAGQRINETIPFTTFFKSPNQFRHDAKNDVLIGSTGDKFYTYVSQDNAFIQADAPKEKVATKELPRSVSQVLLDQNPSLRFVLAKDPAQELLENVTAVAKIDDIEIGDAHCPALKLTLKDKSTNTLAIDPETHLIRRAVFDVHAAYEAQHIPDVKHARYTFEYAKIEIDPAVNADEFAWAPPAGARDLKNVKEPLAAGDDAAEPAMALVGKTVPDFKLSGLDGKAVSRADLKGKVYILDFWATWCGPCRASLPHLDKLYKEKKGDGLVVYAVNVQEPLEKVQNFVNETRLGLPILLDAEGKATEAFKANGIPQTVLVGKDGKVRRILIGFDAGTTPEELKKAVEEALKN